MSKTQAIELLTQAMPQLQLTATEALRDFGTEQAVCIYFTEMYFDTTVYEDFTLPAGEYTALRIELGDAAGKNWWCVLYPALCLSSASGGYDTVAQNELICGEYALRFAAVEWYQAQKK